MLKTSILKQRFDREEDIMRRFMVISTLIFLMTLVMIGIVLLYRVENVLIHNVVLFLLILNASLYPWFNVLVQKGNRRRIVIYIWLALFLLEMGGIVHIVNGAMNHVEIIYALVIVVAGFLLRPGDIYVVVLLSTLSYAVPILLEYTGIIHGRDALSGGIGGISLNYLAAILVTNILGFIGIGFLVSWTIRIADRREKILIANQEKLENAQRMARLVTWELKPDTGMITWSRNVLDLMDLQPDEDLTDFREFVERFIHPEDRYIFENLLSDYNNLRKVRNYEFRILLPDGDERNMRSEIRAVRNLREEVTAVRGTMQDMTEQRMLEKELVHLAHYDDLTDLVNRSLFYRLVAQSIANSRREGGAFALLFLDLDGFKDINDKYGHDAGDRVLRIVAERLEETVRENDIVARMGGDEFAIILQKISSGEDASFVSEKIVFSVNRDIPVGDDMNRVGVSIGIALYPDHGENETELIKIADNAMYQAKNTGKNRYVVHAGRGASGDRGTIRV
jgi:diguanylate cyclase (GGDEF)-like protein